MDDNKSYEEIIKFALLLSQRAFSFTSKIEQDLISCQCALVCSMLVV